MCSDQNNNGPAVDNPIKKQLADGSPPMTSDQLLALLDESGIEHTTRDHPPMWTVDDAKALREPCDYGHTKNLFVRNKKGSMWLLTLHEDRQVDLRETARLVGTNRFSFASEQRLMHFLGVVPGAVSPLSILNDVGGQVMFYIDESLLDAPALHIHPLINTRTTTVRTEELINFIAVHGIQSHVLSFNK